MVAHQVCVVGSGYVGTVVAACFASVGHSVIGLEIDTAKLASLRAGTPHFYEPTLGEKLRAGIAVKRLKFTDDSAAAIKDANAIFICVDAPTTESGQPNMAAISTAARSIGTHLQRDQVVVMKSTVPIGSSRWLEGILKKTAAKNSIAWNASIVSNPEFLREGSAVEDFLYPDRIVIGSEDDEALDLVEQIYQPLLEQSFESGRTIRPTLVRTDLTTAETVKYAANAFLATKISFINEIANIADRVGADIVDVAYAMGLDKRIGQAFLGAGVGWGGSCLGKDLDALSATARSYGLDPLILDAVREVNIRQRHIIITKLQDHLASLRGKRIALLGLAFKPGTDDVRNAPAVDIAVRLTRLNAVVTGYDPVVKDIPEAPDLVLSGTVYEATKGVDAVVVLTDWPEFRQLDFDKISKIMKGHLLIDGRNHLEQSTIEHAGLYYVGIGRKSPHR